MARVVGVYALVIAGVCVVVNCASQVVGRWLNNDVLTYMSYDDEVFETSITWHDLSTGIVQQLYTPDNNFRILTFAWSPDREKIAILVSSLNRSDNFQDYIIVITLSGEEIAHISSSSANIMEMAWYPDGETLLFVATDASTNIYTTNIYTPNNWQWLDTIHPGFMYRNISISPDGEQILYTSYPSDDIYVANADGTNAVRLPITGWSPIWSYDGQSILYVVSDDQDFSSIYVFELGTFERSPLLMRALFRVYVWSYNGRTIAFGSTVGNLFLMNLDSSDLHSFASSNMGFGMVQWMP